MTRSEPGSNEIVEDHPVRGQCPPHWQGLPYPTDAQLLQNLSALLRALCDHGLTVHPT
ncbi:MAG: hypothetical protein IPL99_24045 [Candidatus Competibacteraceae bacterium]|nr:hypothetical protein [Candidatus Competibacteraceae bacterium]